MICAADADRFSALDWRRNALGGSNLVPDGGIGAFVQRRLTRGWTSACTPPVTRIRWGGPGGQVTVETGERFDYRRGLHRDGLDRRAGLAGRWRSIPLCRHR